MEAFCNQAKRDGIHRISSDKDEVIYDVYPGLHPAMTIYGNKLYFKTDKSYQEGASMRHMILENRNQLVNLSGKVQGESIIYLDMDGDDDSEKIFLKMYEKEEDVRVGNYRLQIDDAFLEASGENMEQTLWALSLDGEEIFLVMNEDGPSADPHTVFYKYADREWVLLETADGRPG